MKTCLKEQNERRQKQLPQKRLQLMVQKNEEGAVTDQVHLLPQSRKAKN